MSWRWNCRGCAVNKTGMNEEWEQFYTLIKNVNTFQIGVIWINWRHTGNLKGYFLKIILKLNKVTYDSPTAKTSRTLNLWLAKLKKWLTVTTPSQSLQRHNLGSSCNQLPPSSETDVASCDASEERTSHFSKNIFPCFFSPCVISLHLSMHPLWEGLKRNEKTQVRETWMQSRDLGCTQGRVHRVPPHYPKLWLVILVCAYVCVCACVCVYVLHATPA